MKIVLYSGAGNTFFLVDNRQQLLTQEHIKQLCLSGQVEGVILVEPSERRDVSMRIFNCDGSEAEMCGNGLRCLIHFLKELGIEQGIMQDRYFIETRAGEHQGWLMGDEVCVKLPKPSSMHLHIAPGVHFINTGVPHAVVFVPSVEPIAIHIQGKEIRHCSLFAPAGTNVNFAALQKDGALCVRTYERGVEDETLACGTGATAAALIAHTLFHLSSPIEVRVRSKNTLKISFNHDWSEVTLQGPVSRIKEADFEIKDQNLIMAAV